MDREPQRPMPPRPGAESPRRRPRSLLFILMLIGLITLMVYYGVKHFTPAENSITFGELREEAKAGHIKNIVLKGNTAQGEYNPGQEYRYFRVNHIEKAYLEDAKVLDELEKAVGRKNFDSKAHSAFLEQMLYMIIPWVLIIGLVWYLFFRQLKVPSGGPGGIFSFGKSRAQILSKDQRKVTFADVAGIDEATEEVTEIIEFLKDPKRFQELGGRIPRGVLLVGAAGTGKTLLAKAIAGEAEVPFMSMSGSDFVEMFVGVGASRVRDLFRQAKENSPCIVFLDEIDAVGRHRGSGLGSGHDEREQTLNAILVEMDGFDTDAGVIIIAATNRPDVLDSALLRPGRFDRQIVLDMPDLKGREAILKIHARRIKLDPTVDLATLAKTTPMFSGADLEAIINEAALQAVMKKKQLVEADDLEEARDKVRWGRQKKSRKMEEEDRKVTAYHESGHALAAHLIPEVDPVHKVSIIPRGAFLGATMRLPEKDRYHMQKKYILGNITVLFAGRVAEETFCNDISAGAREDIREATALARAMVCEWGMSEKLGPVSYTESEEHLFLGREITRAKPHSDVTTQEIDREIKSILMSCYQRATELIQQNKDTCNRVGEALLKHEVLTAADVGNIVKGIDIDTLKAQEKQVADSKKTASPVGRQEASAQATESDEAKDKTAPRPLGAAHTGEPRHRREVSHPAADSSESVEKNKKQLSRSLGAAPRGEPCPEGREAPRKISGAGNSDTNKPQK